MDAASGAPAAAVPRDASKLLSAADRDFRAKVYDSAVRLYGEALASAGSDAALKVKIHYARHKAFLSTQRLPQAMGDLSAVIDLDGAHVLAHLQRANLELMTGRCGDAVKDYTRVLTLDASKRDAHSRLPHANECAHALERAAYGRSTGQWGLARDALNEAMAEGRATSAPALLLERAEALLAMGGESELEDALKDLGRVLKMDGNNVRAYAVRGRALMQHGDLITGA